MRILFAHYRPDIVSGAEYALADTIKRLDQNFRVSMLVPGQGRLEKTYREMGFEVWVYPISTPRRLLPGWHTLQSWWLAQKFTQQGIRLVVCNTFAATSRVMTAAKWARLPMVIIVRDYLRDISLHRKVLQKANVLVAISKDIANHIRPMADGLPIHVIYDPIDAEAWLARVQAHRASGMRHLTVSTDVPVVGWVGRLTPYKQPEVFIRAIPFVLEQIPRAQFVIAGSAQPLERDYEKGLHALAEKLGVQNQLQFLGQRADVAELMSEMTVFCLTSQREPLGRVVLEAQLAGCAVVVPDVGGAAELVEDGVTGLKFHSMGELAAENLAARIVELLRDPAKSRCLGEAACQNVQNHFARPDAMAPLSQLFWTLLEQFTLDRN